MLAKIAQRAVPVALGLAATGAMASADGDVLHAPHYKWTHDGPLSAYDAKAIRRGHQVYTQVCASCHSMKFLHYRDLVGVAYSAAEAKALAAEIEVQDGPNDDGEMYDRPGKLADCLPSPYENEEQARAINNGALPPDLSLMAKARHSGTDYLFALLTGYKDPPAGVTVAPGMHYNPYFPGGQIAMPVQLQDGGVEYDDGTPATASQQAKDVATFLTWAAEPKQDQMKQYGNKLLLFLLFSAALLGYHKRMRWAPLKATKIAYHKPKVWTPPSSKK